MYVINLQENLLNILEDLLIHLVTINKLANLIHLLIQTYQQTYQFKLIKRLQITEYQIAFQLKILI